MDETVRNQKLERNLRLLLMEHDEQPEDAYIQFNLAMVYLEQKRMAEALDMFQRSLRSTLSQELIGRKVHAQLIQCLRRLGRPYEALDACHTARRLYPNDPEILFQEALARREASDRKGAIACLERLLILGEPNGMENIDTGLRGYKTRHNLAVFLQEEGRTDDAERQWKLTIDEMPTFAPAIVGLAEIALSRQDFGSLDNRVTQLKSIAKAGQDASTLLGRKCLALRQFNEAKNHIAQAININPTAVWPRVILTHILLQEGSDWIAAENALRDVLSLDPNHVEAKRNLEVLLRQKSQ